MNKKENDTKKHTVVEQAKKGLHEVEEKASEVYHEASKMVNNVVSKENLDKSKEYVHGFTHGVKENAHMILAVVSFVIGLYMLWDVLLASLGVAVGAAFIILAYLLATDFFKKEEKKSK